MHQNLSGALLGRYRFINDFASWIDDLRDGSRDRVAYGEAIVCHAIEFLRRICTDAQYVGYGVFHEKQLG